MPLTQLEAYLRLLARERIAKGGGPGSGEFCALCDKPIGRDEVEYEIAAEFSGGVRAYRFHLVCQSVWQLECARDDYLKKRP
jgi:hypothetical protein